MSPKRHTALLLLLLALACAGSGAGRDASGPVATPHGRIIGSAEQPPTLPAAELADRFLLPLQPVYLPSGRVPSALLRILPHNGAVPRIAGAPARSGLGPRHLAALPRSLCFPGSAVGRHIFALRRIRI